MANPTWSEEKKSYVNQLCRNRKKIWFSSFSSKKGRLGWNTEKNSEYEILLGFCKDDDFYVALKAENHRTCKSITMNKALEKIDVKNLKKIENTIQYSNTYGTQKIVVIPCSQLENFCKSIDSYFNTGGKK